MTTLGDLPLEIHILLLRQVPDLGLKLTLKYWYALYNDLFYDKIVASFGEAIIPVIVKVLPWLKVYIKSMDAFRFQCRKILADYLGLEDVDDPGTANPFHCCYVKDLWRYVYLVLKNKRLFANHEDYNVDIATNYVYRHFVEVNQLYLLSYKKVLWLAPGKYNLNIALVVKHGLGLGTTKFQIRYLQNDGLGQGRMVEQTFFPPINIKDILPKNQFCFLKLGEFEIAPTSNNYDATGTSKSNIPDNKLVRVKFVMEELGLYLKLGFLVFFIDFSQPTTLFNDYDLLYYLVAETNYKFFVNLPLKNLYRAIEYVQMGYHGDQPGAIEEENEHDEEDESLFQLRAAPVAAEVRARMGGGAPPRDGIPRRESSVRRRLRTILDATQDIAFEAREFEQALKYYGQGDPGLIPGEYDLEFLNDKEIDGERAEIRKVTSNTRLLHSLWLLLLLNNLLHSGTPPPARGESIEELVELGQDVHDLLIKCKHLPGLMTYANFFFNNRHKNRYFKFNTVYQLRQFINRFGDFELDWQEVTQSPVSEVTQRKCTYDRDGLKWKIPTLGEL